MLIIRNQDKIEGSWFDFSLRGADVMLKIRPLTTKVIEDIRKKYKTVKQIKGVRTETFDDEAIGEAMIDHILEDFDGFGGEDGKKLPATLDSKKLIMGLPALEDEISLSTFVFEKAKELCAAREEDAVKN